LREASAVLARLAVRVANADEFPAKRLSADEVQRILDTHPDLEGYRVARELGKRTSE
jgi:hypothetical protein